MSNDVYGTTVILMAVEVLADRDVVRLLRKFDIQ